MGGGGGSDLDNILNPGPTKFSGPPSFFVAAISRAVLEPKPILRGFFPQEKMRSES